MSTYFNVRVNGALKTEGVHYLVNHARGTITLTLNNVPGASLPGKEVWVDVDYPACMGCKRMTAPVAQSPQPTVGLTVNLAATAPWEVSEAVHNLFAALHSEGAKLSMSPMNVSVNLSADTSQAAATLRDIERAVSDAISRATRTP